MTTKTKLTKTSDTWAITAWTASNPGGSYYLRRERTHVNRRLGLTHTKVTWRLWFTATGAKSQVIGETEHWGESSLGGVTPRAPEHSITSYREAVARVNEHAN